MELLTLNLILCMTSQAQGISVSSKALSGDASPQLSDEPVDGGLSLLLAAGAAYGVRRVRRRR